MTIAAIGTLRKNTARQLTCSTSQPPRTGPIAVVMAPKPDHVPIARPRSLFECRADDRQAARHEERGADSLDRAPTISISGDRARPHRIDAAVKQRRRQEHAPAAELVAHRAADQNQRAEEQRVRFDHPLHVGDRGAKVGLQRGQRDVDDGARR